MRPSFTAWPVFASPSPASRFGPSPASAAGPARARATCLSLRVTNAAGPRVGRLLPPHAGRISFSCSTDRNPSPNLSFPFLEPPSSYISRMPSPTATISSFLQSLWCSRVRSPRAGALAVASPSRATSLVRPRLRFCSR
jgi:hypothetical protein